MAASLPAGTPPPFTIDGAIGEGGGQVLRTSVALAALTGTPLRVTNIRAGRPKPGLQRSHLVAMQAAATVAHASLLGGELGSTEIVFVPPAGGCIASPPPPSPLELDIGSAGSTTLVLQTILPLLLCGSAPVSVSISGGTHNPFAPPADFLAHAFAPAAFGAAASGSPPRLELACPRLGFYPAGGGRLTARVTPYPHWAPALARGAAPPPPVSLLSRGGALQSVTGQVILVGDIPAHVAAREEKALRVGLSSLRGVDVSIETVTHGSGGGSGGGGKVSGKGSSGGSGGGDGGGGGGKGGGKGCKGGGGGGSGPAGNAVVLTMCYPTAVEVVMALGERGKKAEDVAAEALAAAGAEGFLPLRDSSATAPDAPPVSSHLADQLLLPLLLGGGGTFRATSASLHFVTNAAVINTFLGEGVVSWAPDSAAAEGVSGGSSDAALAPHDGPITVRVAAVGPAAMAAAGKALAARAAAAAGAAATA